MTRRPTRTPPEAVQTAFRELHGARLHAFALLLTLGERSEAAALASEALAAGVERIEELRHPERAAAWLRRRIVEGAGGRRRPRDRSTGAGTLESLGVDPPALHALAALGTLERAVLVASTVERLDRRDVGHIVGRDGSALDRLLRRAHARYTDAYAAPDGAAGGPIVSHILEVAQRAMA